jgi:hypothetical protein
MLEYAPDYVTASTRLRPGPFLARARQWLPAGTAHAVLRDAQRGPADVTMCGQPVDELHVFARRDFAAARLCHECPDCRAWVRSEAARIAPKRAG